MNSLLKCKVVTDDIEVEYEVLPSLDNMEGNDPRRQKIIDGLSAVNERIQSNQSQIDALNREIDRLTNHADGMDYIVAVGSGIIAGFIDSVWVGKFDYNRGKAWSNKSVNDFVMKVAKSQGYQGERLDGAIKHLEDKYKIPSDNIWKGKGIGVSARSHHIDDLAHHPTPIGLFFSILTQFTREGYFSNSEGDFFSIEVDDNGGLFGTDIPSKLFCGTVNWFFHLVSDMSGSNKTAGVGMGIPGPVVSLLKAASAIPGLNKTGLSRKIKEIFVKERFNLRSELAVAHELARQAVPVILNEVVVRAFYFIRRLIMELQEKRDLSKVDWKKTIPFRNRTIVRMLTIATGTFTLFDMIDAAIRGAINSKGNSANFLKEFVLHINFVGIGRFAIAGVTDIVMGIKREKLRNERIAINNEQLQLMNAKIFYLQADVWIAAEGTERAITDAIETMKRTIMIFIDSLNEIEANMNKIGGHIASIKKTNPKLIEEISDVMKWG